MLFLIALLSISSDFCDFLVMAEFNTSIEDQIKLQGDKVRQMKLEKAPKEQV